jgi:DNA polymerase-3 subunit delta'
MSLYPWQSQDWLSFQRLKQASATLIAADAGMGSLDFARHTAQGWLCPHEPAPCGRCQSCHWFVKAAHPDFLEMDTEKEMGIDAIRHLNAWLCKSPYRHLKVALLPSVERLTPFAAASLLKTLEEPPLFARFILTAKHAALLDPTITSRLQIYRLQAPSREQALTWLIESGVEPAAFFLVHAHGLPLLARTLAHGDYRAHYEAFVRHIAHRNYDSLSRLPMELPQLLGFWQRGVFDLMWYHHKKAVVFAGEWTAVVAQEALQLSPIKLARLWEALSTMARKNDSAPLQQSLQADAIASIYARLRDEYAQRSAKD